MQRENSYWSLHGPSEEPHPRQQNLWNSLLALLTNSVVSGSISVAEINPFKKDRSCFQRIEGCGLSSCENAGGNTTLECWSTGVFMAGCY